MKMKNYARFLATKRYQTIINQNIKRIRKETKMNISTLHPKVVEMVDKLNLTPLQGFIVNLLTDPEVEYSPATIASQCFKVIGKGSKRHVRRIKSEFAAHIDDILLQRELELNQSFVDAPVNVIGTGTIITAPDKGGNGADHEGITEMSDGGWDVTEHLDCVTACSKAPDKAVVYCSSVARKKVNLYMKWAGRQEWLAYLIGKWISDHEVEVMDIALPNQSADATLVNQVDLENYNELGVVGVIHSHHEMGGAGHDKAGFSGHDEAFINSNHNVSLLVAKDGIAGHIRVKTPCGAFLRITAKVKQLDEVEVDEKKLKAEFQEKIRFGQTGRGWNGGTNRYFDDPKNSINANDIDRNNYHFRS